MSVNTNETDWAELIREASNVKSPQGPIRLIGVLSKLENPLSQDQDVWDAHRLDFGTIRQVSSSTHPTSAHDRSVWVDRLAWFLQALEASNTKRPDLKTLVAILHSAQAFSIGVPIWNRLQKHYFTKNIFSSMAAIIRGLQCSFDTSGPFIPIWERETTARFEQADKGCDWPTIESLWQSFASTTVHDIYVSEATACLVTTDTGLRILTVELDRFTSILPLMGIVQCLTSIQIGKIAALANSNRCRFSLIQTIAFNHRNKSLQNETLTSLATVFKYIQQDHSEWMKWMITFNRYPVRSKSLQPAIGMSLVNSDIKVKQAYIETIRLSKSHTEGRNAVTKCLQTFSSIAAIEERKQLWALNYEKWKRWSFGKDESENHLTCMPVTELDYGVLSYIAENLTDVERKTKLSQIGEELSQVQNNWHSDILTFNSSWYRALAQWQVFQHAEHVLARNVNWELPMQKFLPFDPKTDRYFALYLPVKLEL